MRRYKVKCEVWSDFHELHQRVSAAGIPIRHLATTVDVLFEADGRLEWLRELSGQIDDAQLMVDTLAYAED